jgi:DNA repair protein RadC
VDLRILFGTALKAKASSIVIDRNHPSNNLQPSDANLELTKKIKEAGKFVDINLFDHLILGTDDNYVSFAEKGWL